MWGFGSYIPRRRGSPRAQIEEAPPGCFLMVVLPMLFLMSTYFAWEEFCYIILGKRATAKVERVIETVNESRRGRPLYGVEYCFEDDVTNESRIERDDIPKSWKKPLGTIEVEYLPGHPDWSRIAGNRHYLSLLFFLVCLVVVGAYGIYLFREARQAVRESELHEARRRKDGE